jgi:hypothetical protein
MRVFFSGPRIMGVRPGVSFGAEDFRRLAGNRQRQGAEPVTGAFVYVIRGDHNMTKIGVTTNPSARIASLRTASPFPLEFAFIGAMPDNDGYVLEKAAHTALERFRCNGEWFDISPENAVATIIEASKRCRLPPMVPLTQDQADLVLKVAAGEESLPSEGGARKWPIFLILFLLLWALCFWYVHTL